MTPFERHTGIVAPLDRANVDTDAIIPKQFMKSLSRTGYGDNLFDAWRYLDVGVPGVDCSDRPVNSSFVLNQTTYKNASILLARENFGCGSSREHAPWALRDFGLRVLIAPSFGDIFYVNSIKNGILPVTFDLAECDELFAAVSKCPGVEFSVDLPGQTVLCLEQVYRFQIDPHWKNFLIQGLDEIDATLRHAEKITAYEVLRRNREPWLFPTLPMNE